MKTEQNPALEALANMAREAQENFSTQIRYTPSTPTKERLEEQAAYARRTIELYQRTHDIMEKTRQNLEPYRRTKHKRITDIYATVRRFRESRAPGRFIEL